MISRISAYFAVAVVFGALALKLKIDFKYEDFKDYLVLISGVSGMVFTIMGIWIAFLYPNAVSRIVDPNKIVAADFSESQSDSKRLESIVGAIAAAGVVMIAALVITLTKVILFLSPFYLEHRIYIKSGALSLALFMTLLQMESVFKVLLANIMFINDLHFKRQARESEED